MDTPCCGQQIGPTEMDLMVDKLAGNDILPSINKNPQVGDRRILMSYTRLHGCLDWAWHIGIFWETLSKEPWSKLFVEKGTEKARNPGSSQINT